MGNELTAGIGGELRTVLLQAGGAAVLCLAVMGLCRRAAVHVERETVISLLRGFLQIALIGILLAMVLHRGFGVGVLILFAMTIAAAVIASRRAGGIPGALQACFVAVAAGSGLTMAAMASIGAVTADLATLVPVGSMVIASAMNSSSQAAERFRTEVASQAGLVEAALALGASPTAAVSAQIRSAVYASLIPRLDSLQSLGIVWVPGMMAGMILSGANPVFAGIYQFIVMAMIYAASGITALSTTLLLRRRIFTPAAQLAVKRSDPARI